jgi:uncharacterized Zn-binding protein involved in type VI secretion
MSRPIAHLISRHTCAKPGHEGARMIGPGEPTVLVAGIPVARYSDMARCLGTPEIDALSLGAPTVFIGKLPAGRLGDPSLHGGLLVTGETSVLVGEPPPQVTVVRRGKMLVIVDRAAKTITLVGVQEFEGEGATPEFIATATDSINTTWRGPTTFEGQPYEVDCMVSGRKIGSIQDPLANEIHVVKTSVPLSVTSKGLFAPNQPVYGKGRGLQYTTDEDDGYVVAAHEFGHSMGLRDEYIELPAAANGERQIQHTGPPGGLMGYVDPGSRPTADNFDSLINGKGLYE